MDSDTPITLRSKEATDLCVDSQVNFSTIESFLVQSIMKHNDTENEKCVY